MSTTIRNHVATCETCKKFKKSRRKYGKLPVKDVTDEVTPWETVQIDTIGPYSLTTKDGKYMELFAKTMIDPATGWFEIQDMKDTNNSADAARIFNNSWLSRYPRPKRLIMDNGKEFKGDFYPLLNAYGIKAKRTTVKNPQANAVLERVHQVIGDMLRTHDLENYEFDHEDSWTDILASVAWAIRSSVHSTKEATPGQLVFGRDMIFHDTFRANWQAIHMHKVRDTLKNNERENKTRNNHIYKDGDYALVTDYDVKRKMMAPNQGPYLINKVMTNGTVKLQRGPVEETINIRRLIPFKGTI